jgi:hypothetical protein
MAAIPAAPSGRHVPISATRLFVTERAQGYSILLLHGGPGLDHHMFGDYLDPLVEEHEPYLATVRSFLDRHAG